MAAPNEITVPQLLRLIGTPDAPVIVDISIDPDFDAEAYLIPGAIRHPHTGMAGLMARLDAGMALYDALYRWAKGGANETHDWPGVTSGRKS